MTVKHRQKQAIGKWYGSQVAVIVNAVDTLWLYYGDEDLNLGEETKEKHAKTVRLHGDMPNKYFMAETNYLTYCA